tara:strand:+ start:530 stop:3478 length:2949 start_codon:yes stop_codon:yes gene_type:complete
MLTYCRNFLHYPTLPTFTSAKISHNALIAKAQNHDYFHKKIAEQLFLILFTALHTPKLIKQAHKGILPKPVTQNSENTFSTLCYAYKALCQETTQQFINLSKEPKIFFKDDSLIDTQLYQAIHQYLAKYNLLDYWKDSEVAISLNRQNIKILIMISSQCNGDTPRFLFSNAQSPDNLHKEKILLKLALQDTLATINTFLSELSNSNLTSLDSSEQLIIDRLSTSLNNLTSPSYNLDTTSVRPSTLANQLSSSSLCSVLKNDMRYVSLFLILTTFLNSKYLPKSLFFAACYLATASKRSHRAAIKKLSNEITLLNKKFLKRSQKTQSASLKMIPQFISGILCLQTNHFSSNFLSTNPYIIPRRRLNTFEYVSKHIDYYLPPSENQVPESMDIWQKQMVLDCFFDDAADGCLPTELKAQSHKLTLYYAKDTAFMSFFFILSTIPPLQFQNFLIDVKDSIKQILKNQKTPQETVSPKIVSETVIFSLSKIAPEFSLSLQKFPWFKYNFNLCITDYLQGCLSHDLDKKIDNFNTLKTTYDSFLQELKEINQTTIANASLANSKVLAKFLLGSKKNFTLLFSSLRSANDDIYLSYRHMCFLTTSNLLSATNQSNQALTFHQIHLLTLSHVYNAHQLERVCILDSLSTTPMLHNSFLSYFFKQHLDTIFNLCQPKSPPLSIKQNTPISPLSSSYLENLKKFIDNFFNLLKANHTVLNGQTLPDHLDLNYFQSNFLSFQNFHELSHLGQIFLNKFNYEKPEVFNLEIQYLAHIIQTEPKLLNSLFEIYIYLEQIETIQLLEKFSNDFDCLEELTDQEFSLTPISLVLTGIKSADSFKSHLYNLLDITDPSVQKPVQKLSLKKSHLQFMSIDYDYSINSHFFVDKLRNSIFTNIPIENKIRSNLNEIEQIFRDGIDLYKKKLVSHYKQQDFIDLFTHHPDYIDVINNIINRLTNVLDMYINRLQNDLHNRSEPQVFHVMAKSEEELFNLV